MVVAGAGAVVVVVIVVAAVALEVEGGVRRGVEAEERLADAAEDVAEAGVAVAEE